MKILFPIILCGILFSFGCHYTPAPGDGSKDTSGKHDTATLTMSFGDSITFSPRNTPTVLYDSVEKRLELYLYDDLTGDKFAFYYHLLKLEKMTNSVTKDLHDYINFRKNFVPYFYYFDTAYPFKGPPSFSISKVDLSAGRISFQLKTKLYTTGSKDSIPIQIDLLDAPLIIVPSGSPVLRCKIDGEELHDYSSRKIQLTQPYAFNYSPEQGYILVSYVSYTDPKGTYDDRFGMTLYVRLSARLGEYHLSNQGNYPDGIQIVFTKPPYQRGFDTQDSLDSYFTLDSFDEVRREFSATFHYTAYDAALQKRINVTDGVIKNMRYYIGQF
jgi:hypothetical protein